MNVSIQSKSKSNGVCGSVLGDFFGSVRLGETVNGIAPVLFYVGRGGGGEKGGVWLVVVFALRLILIFIAHLTDWFDWLIGPCVRVERNGCNGYMHQLR